MSVLILTSTQNSERHLQKWMERIEKLDPSPKKVIFCENDSSDRTKKIIENWSFPHELISFKSDPEDLKHDIYAVIAKNRQKLLDRAKELDPDFAVFLDDDVFAHDDNLIQKLSSHNLDFVGGAYLRFFNNQETYLASQWSVEAPINEMPNLPNLTESIENAKARGVPFLLFSNCDNMLYKVTITSAGCLCLSRKVIQDSRLGFFPKKKMSGYNEVLSEDFQYCLIARNLGYEVYLDGATRLDHMMPWVGKERPWINLSYR